MPIGPEAPALSRGLFYLLWRIVVAMSYPTKCLSSLSIEEQLTLAAWVVAGVVSQDGNTHQPLRSWTDINPYPIFDLEELGGILDDLIRKGILKHTIGDQFELLNEDLAIDCYDQDTRPYGGEWAIVIENETQTEQSKWRHEKFLHAPHFGMRFRLNQYELEIREIDWTKQRMRVRIVEPGGQLQ
jgi:hypothetical protein